MSENYLLVLKHVKNDVWYGNVSTCVLPKTTQMQDFCAHQSRTGDAIYAAFIIGKADEKNLSDVRMQLYNAAQEQGKASPSEKELVAGIKKSCKTAKLVPLEELLAGAA